MRKKIFMALCAAVMSTAIKAQPAFPPMMGGGNSNEDVASYKQVKVGDITMSINPEKGGKIMSLTYKDNRKI